MVCFNRWTGPERCFFVYHLVSFLFEEVVLFCLFTYLYLLEVYLTTTIQHLKTKHYVYSQVYWNWNADSSSIRSLSWGGRLHKTKTFHDLTFAHQDKTNHILLLILIEPQLGSSLSKPLAWLSLVHQWSQDEPCIKSRDIGRPAANQRSSTPSGTKTIRRTLVRQLGR